MEDIEEHLNKVHELMEDQTAELNRLRAIDRDFRGALDVFILCLLFYIYGAALGAYAWPK